MSPTPTPPPDAPLVVATFLARYLVDRENHGTLTLRDYQTLFPGYEDVIAREWARLFEDPDEQQGRFDVARQGMDGRRLGRYRIERELGRGGQGVVYLAQDEALRRPVALKILPAALAQTVEMRQRFLREAEAASRLDDPGICTVYETGEEDGVAYIAMRYVEGESLAARLGRMAFDEETLPDRSGVRDWVELIARCSEALHAAHEAGLVHRDIKPGNVMVAPDGRPVILDFGLARMEDHPDGSLTRTGDILGTPAYMSPEQVAAREEPIDRRSDVFSLGATLYECLAQRRAFSAPTRERLYRQIENVDPPPPSRFNKSIPRDLDVVVACALDKDPERRYATAAAFAEDLRRVLGREPVSARPAGPVVRTARWAERNPVVAALLCLIFVGLGAFGVWQGLQATALSGALADASASDQRTKGALAVATASEQRTKDALAIATASEQRTKGALAAVTASEKRIAEELVRSEGARCAALATQVIDDNAELAVLLAKEALRVHPSPAARSAAWDALARFQPRTLVQFEEGAAWWCALSPSGDRLVVGLNNPKGIEIWDPASLTRLRRIPFDKGQLERWCVSPTGDVIAVAQKLESRATATTTVHLISLATGVTRHKLPHDGLVGALAFSADGELLATGTAKDEFNQSWAGPGGGKDPASYSYESVTRIFDVARGRQVATFDGSRGSIVAVAIGPAATGSTSTRGIVDKLFGRTRTGRRVVTVDLAGTVKELWLNTGRVISKHAFAQRFSLSGGQVDGVRILLDKNLVIAASGIGQGRFRCLHLDTGEMSRSLIGDGYSEQALGPVDGDRVLSMPWARDIVGGGEFSSRYPVTIRDLRSGELIARLGDHGFNAAAAAWLGTPGADDVAVVHDDGSLRIYDDEGRLKARYSGNGHVMHACFSADGSRVAVATRAGNVETWLVETGRALPSVKGVVFSLPTWDRGHLLARTRGETSIITPPSLRTTSVGVTGAVATADVSADGRTWIACTGMGVRFGRDAIAHDREGPSGSKGEEGLLSAAAASPDGTLVAAGGWGGGLRVWEVATGAIRATLAADDPERVGKPTGIGPPVLVVALRFLDGDRLLVVTDAGTRIRDLRHRTWLGEGGFVCRQYAAGFSSDDRFAIGISGYRSSYTSYQSSASRFSLIDVQGATSRSIRLSSGMGIHSAAMSPDGSTAWLGGRDGTVCAASVTDGRVLWTQNSPDSRQVTDIAPLAGGSLVVFRPSSGPVRVLDARDGTEVHRIEVGGQAPRGLIVDPDGRWFAIPKRDGTQFYPLDPLKWIEDHISVRDLTPAERRKFGLGR